MPTSEEPTRGSSLTSGRAHIPKASVASAPTSEKVAHPTRSNSRETVFQNTARAAKQTSGAPSFDSSRKGASREPTRPTSRLQGNIRSTVSPKVPVDVASQLTLFSSQYDVVLSNDTSRESTGVASHHGAALLPGIVPGDNWDAVQENTYVVLGHGPYQRRVLMCGILSATVGLFHYLAYRLIGRQVDHWCMVPDHLAYLSVAAWKNLSIPVEANGSYSSCTVYDPPVPVSEGENRTAVACHQWDYEIANKGDSIVSRFNLVCDRKFLYDLSAVVPVIASAIVAPVLGLVSDHVGRKPVMLACAFGQMLTTIATSFAETYPFFVFTRALTFVASDVTFLTTFILIHEVTGDARRSIFTLIDTAVPGVVVPPLMHVLSLLEPRWMLAEALIIVTGGLLVAWCWLQVESPAWLIATWDLPRAEDAVLLAAKTNGIDVTKARSTFMVIKEQLHKLGKVYAADAPMEAITESIKMRRRAASAFLARLALDATYIGLMIKDVTTGIPCEAAHVVLLTAYYASICSSMRRYGLRETLSGLMVILSAFAIFEAIAIFTEQQAVACFLHAGMKVAVSGAMSVTLCYTAETFPTAVRSAGISLSHFSGGVGNVVAIAAIALGEPHVFYALSAFMVLLSVAAIQWLPEVFIEIPQRPQLPSELSERERKAVLLASLDSRRVSTRKRRENSPREQSKLTY